MSNRETLDNAVAKFRETAKVIKARENSTEKRVIRPKGKTMYLVKR